MSVPGLDENRRAGLIGGKLSCTVSEVPAITVPFESTHLKARGSASGSCVTACRDIVEPGTPTRTGLLAMLASTCRTLGGEFEMMTSWKVSPWLTVNGARPSAPSHFATT